MAELSDIVDAVSDAADSIIEDRRSIGEVSRAGMYFQ